MNHQTFQYRATDRFLNQTSCHKVLAVENRMEEQSSISGQKCQTCNSPLNANNNCIKCDRLPKLCICTDKDLLEELDLIQFSKTNNKAIKYIRPCLNTVSVTILRVHILTCNLQSCSCVKKTTLSTLHNGIIFHIQRIGGYTPVVLPYLLTEAP